MSTKYANLENTMKQIIEIIKDGFISENSLIEINLKLDQFNADLQDVENNDECLLMRRKLIENIVRNNIKMTEINDDELCKENAFLYAIERTSNHLKEEIDCLENDIENISNASHKEFKSYPSDVVKDLIKATESSYSMTLSAIHELTSSMMELPESGKLQDKLTEIKDKNIICLMKLLELHDSTSSLTMANSSNDKFDEQETQEKLNVLKNTFEMNSSGWMDNLEDFLILLERFSYIASDNDSANKPVSTNVSSFSSTTLMGKINSRLDYLIKFIRKNINLNYEDELSLLHQALSQLESNAIDIDKETCGNVNILNMKLKELEGLIQNKDFSSFSSINLIHSEIENNSIFNSTSETFFVETLEHLKNRSDLISVKSSLIEKEILNSILSPDEFLSKEYIENIEMPENEKLNQYHELIQVFQCFIEALKLNIMKSPPVETDNFIHIECEIKIMKNVMIVVMTSISMLENYSRSIFTIESKENDPFTQTMKSEALSLVNEAIEKILDNEKSIKISNIFLEDVEPIIKLLEKELEELLTNTAWNVEQYKSLLHKSSWLVNIWQYNSKPVQCSTLSERFQRLITILNSVKKEQYKHLAMTHFHEETTREYWFQILQDWQSRVDTFLANNLSATSDNWTLFSWRMHLICEFEQIDSNIDHYGVNFESDFLDFLHSQKSDLDKINKIFINQLLDKKEPIYKYLQFVSKEIKNLNENQRTDHTIMESLKLVQRSLQTGMQILEYIHSILDQIDENYVEKSQIINDQIRKLRLALHSSKKSFMILSNQIGRLNDELDEMGVSLDRVDESVESIETLMKSEINTLLARGYNEMLNRCEITMKQIKTDIKNVENQLLPYESDKLKSVKEAGNLIKIRVCKIQLKIPKIEQEINDFKVTITSIIDQQNETFPLKNDLEIYLTKIDVYFTGIDMGSITSKESAENYLQHIDQLFAEMESQEEIIKRIEIVNYRILENNSQIKVLKPIFDSEVSQLINSFKSVNQLKQVKIDLTEKKKVLCEIDKKFKFCITEIDKTKRLILSESGNTNSRISQNIETVRDLIGQSHLYLHQVVSVIDRDHMTALAKDFEQMDALLDLYDELIKYRKNKEIKKQSFVKSIHDKNERTQRDLIEFNKKLTEIGSDWNRSMNGSDFLYQIEEMLNHLVKMKNEVLNSAIDICTYELTDSKMPVLCQECYTSAVSSINWLLSIITNLLVYKFSLSGRFNEFFCQTCKRWSLLIRNCIEFDGDKFEFHDKLVYIETIQMILDCFVVVSEQRDKLALSAQSIQEMASFRIQASELISSVKMILESSKKLDTKMFDFQILRTTISTCSDKLNFHLILVESLSEDCGVQKHIQMKQQSNFYRAYIKYHHNLYRLFNQIIESILDENVLGFEIEDGIQISLEEMTTSIETINKKHQNALRDIDSSLAEWRKSLQTEISTRRFMNSLHSVLKELNDEGLLNRVHYHMYIEKLSLLIKHLKDKEFQWSNLKIQIGSSSDQAYLQQRIKITQACVSVSQSIVARNSIRSKSLLFLYQELCTEAENIKLNLLTLLNDSHYFYLENELTFGERKQFLTQFKNSLNQTEMTVEIWKMRSYKIYPELINSYCSKIDLKSQSLEQWFGLCLNTMEEISANLNNYESKYNALQIKLHVIGEHLEQIENCDDFLRKILAKFYQYNLADFRNCLKLSEIIIKQMNDIEFQLQQLHNLKEQLYQLILGQNGNCHECDKGKLTDFQQVVELISNSQATIRDELLNIVNQESKRTVKSTLTYSCCEDEIECYDKQISVSGEIESFLFIFSNEISKTNSSDSPKLKLPPSSIAEQVEKRVSNLEDLFKQVISSIDDQEAYLNDKWTNQAFDNPKISRLNCDNKTELKDENLFSCSTPLKSPLKHTDMHHWFPNTSEAAIQTINDLDIESDLANMISPISSESSVTCPNYHLSGLTSSEEIKKSNSDLVIIARERSEETANIMETVQEIVEPRILELSENGSSLSIECINHSDLVPHVQALNEDEKYENVDVIVDNVSTGVLEICIQREEVGKSNIKSNECNAFTSENDSRDKLYKIGNDQVDSNEIDKQNMKNKQPLTIDVLHSILHDIVDNVIKDDLPESDTIFLPTNPILIEETKENIININEVLAIERETPTLNGNSQHSALLGIESSTNPCNPFQDRYQDQTENQKTIEDAIYIEVSQVTEEEIEKDEKNLKLENSEDDEADKSNAKENLYDIELENVNKIYPISGDSNENESELPLIHQFNANNENRNSSINIICKIQSNNDLIVPSVEALYIDRGKGNLFDINNEKDFSIPDEGFNKQHDTPAQGDSLTEVSSENSINESFAKLNADLNDDEKLPEMKTDWNVEVQIEPDCDVFSSVKRENTSYEDPSIVRVSETAEDIQSNENELKSNINSCTIKEIEMKESLVISTPFTIENTNMNVKDDYRPVQNKSKNSDREIFYSKHPNSKKFTKFGSDSQRKDHQNEGNSTPVLNAIEMEPSNIEMNNKCSSKSLMTETAKLCIPNISDDKYVEDIESINALSQFSALETFKHSFNDILINEIDNEIDSETRKCRENEVEKLDCNIHNEAPNKDSKLSEKSSFTSLNVENLNEIEIDYNPSDPGETGGQSDISVHPNDAEMFHSTNDNRNIRVNVNIVDENPQPLSEIRTFNVDSFHDTVEQDNGSKIACVSKTESYSSQTDVTESLDSRNSKHFTLDSKIGDSVQITIESEGQIYPEHLLAKAINCEYPVSSDVHKQSTIMENKSTAETLMNTENYLDQVENIESFTHLPTNSQDVIQFSLPESLELTNTLPGKGYGIFNQNNLNDTLDEFEIENDDKLQIHSFNDNKIDLENEISELTSLQVNPAGTSESFKELNSQVKDSDNEEPLWGKSSSRSESEILPEAILACKNHKEQEEIDIIIINDLACKSEIKKLEGGYEISVRNILLDHEKTGENFHMTNDEEFECEEIPFRKTDTDQRAETDELNSGLTQEPNDITKLVIKKPDQDISSINDDLVDPRLSTTCENSAGPCTSLSDVKESDVDKERVNSSQQISIFEKTNLCESEPDSIGKLENNEIGQSFSTFNSMNSENEMLRKILNTKYDSLVDLSDKSDRCNVNKTSQNSLETYENSLEANYGIHSTSVVNDNSLVRGSIVNSTVEFVGGVALLKENDDFIVPDDNANCAHLLSENNGKSKLHFIDGEEHISGDLVRWKVLTNLENTDNLSSRDEAVSESNGNDINSANISQSNKNIVSDILKTYPDTELENMESNIGSVENRFKEENIKEIDLSKDKKLSKPLSEPFPSTDERAESNTKVHGQLENVNTFTYNTPMENITDLGRDQNKSNRPQIQRDEIVYDEDHFNEDVIENDKILRESLIDNSKFPCDIEMPSKSSEKSVENDTEKLSESQISDPNVALGSIKSDKMNFQSGEDDYMPNFTTTVSQLDGISPDLSTEFESNLNMIRSNINEEEEPHNFENELDLSKAFDSSVNEDSYENEMSERNTDSYFNIENETNSSLPCMKQDGDLPDNYELQFPKEHVLIVSTDNENHIPRENEEVRETLRYKSELRNYVNVDQLQPQSDPVIFSSGNENDGYNNFDESESRKGQAILTRSTIQRTSLTILPKIDKPVLKKRLSKSLELYSHSLDFNDHSLSNSTSQEMVSFSLKSEEEPRPSFPEQSAKYEKSNKRDLNIGDERDLSGNVAKYEYVHNLSKPSENSLQRCDCGLWKFILLGLLFILLIVSFCISHIPISRHCNSFYYNILYNMNPFHIKRFVPV